MQGPVIAPETVHHVLHGVHKTLLPPGVVDRGVVFRGAGWRLRRVVTSLLAGDTTA